jgi:hypothetical protein
MIEQLYDPLVAIENVAAHEREPLFGLRGAGQRRQVRHAAPGERATNPRRRGCASARSMRAKAAAG